MVRCLIFVLFFLSPIVVFGQKTIYGVVYDSLSKSPLPFANLFLNNTAIGTSTDSSGRFEIKNIQFDRVNLIVSFIGYKRRSFWLEIGNETINLEIGLKPLSYILEEVTVKGERDTNRKKYLHLFEKEFLGKNDAATKCLLINSDSIDIYEDENKILIAKSDAPIEIENRELGLRIKFYLLDFKWSKGSYSIKGNSFFQYISPKSEKQLLKWRANRENAYLGSIQHFIKALKFNELEKSGFKLYLPIPGKADSPRSPYFYTRELDKTVHQLPEEKIIRDAKNEIFIVDQPIEIHYTLANALQKRYADVYHQVSWLESISDTIKIDSKGQLINPTEIILAGDMSERRISQMLPLDYVTNRIEKKLSDISEFKETNSNFYIHTSKPYYYPGDSIWFKLYSWQKFGFIDSSKQEVYVDLISPTKKVLLTYKQNSTNNAQGVFILGDSISGNYFIRAYLPSTGASEGTELFYQQIPVLDAYHSIMSIELDTIARWGIDISSAEKEYNTRSKVVLDIEVLDSIFESSLSVSVVDSMQSLTWQGHKSILSKSQAHSTRESSGLTFVGHLNNLPKKRFNYWVNIIQPNLQYFSTVEVKENGEFVFDGLDFYDSLNFLFQLVSKKEGVAGDFSIKENTMKVNGNFPVKEIAMQTLSSPNRSDAFRAKSGTIILDEVEVKASRTGIRTGLIYGKPNYVLGGDNLSYKNGATNLLMALNGKVPGVKVNSIFDDSGTKKIEVRIAGASSSFFYNDPLILLDGIPWSIQGLNGLEPNLVDRIEVISNGHQYGVRGSSGIISIITKMGPYASEKSRDLLRKFNSIKLIGYKKSSNFFSPNYDLYEYYDGWFDYRSTLFWEPQVNPNQFGKAAVSFYTSDVEGTYKVIVQGVVNNEPVFGLYYFHVSDP